MDLNTQAFYLINNGLHNHYLDIIMPHISNCGGLVFYAGILLILLVLTRNNIFSLKIYYPLVRLCIFSLILCVVITACIKILFSAPRPFVVLGHVNILTSSVDPNSFPSGHTAITLSLMTVLFLKAKDYFTRAWLVRCLAVFYAFLIGFSRIYIGMHFPFDVLVGALIGMVSGVVAVRRLKV